MESFVDTDHFLGTSYRAANWVAIGQTQGRGRQDREHQSAKSIKTIYVYELESDLRTRLGVAAPAGLVALEIAEGLDGEEWAANEFAGANLGDRRLNERLGEFARTLGKMPGRAFCGAAQGDKAAIKAYYRLIERPDDSQVSMEAILAPHRLRTVQRMKAQLTVLCIQDGTDVNYSTLVQCVGLGVIGSNQTGAQSGGLHLHSTLVLSTEGLPLGVLGAQCSAATPRAKDDLRPTSAIPIEEKKSFAWIKGLRECNELAAELPDTRQVCVMDREADFYELFDEQRRSRGVELLVRAKHDRATSEEINLFDAVRHSPVQSQLRINVPRQSSRAKKSKQKGRLGHEQRTAQVSLRYREVELRPASNHPGKKALKLWVVHVLEASPPADAEPVEWFLFDDLLDQHSGAGPGVSALVLPALAHRRLASRPQKRLPHRDSATQDGRATQTRHRHQSGHCLANHAHEAPGQRVPGAFRRGIVRGPRDRSAAGLRKKNESPSPLASAMPSVL